MREGKSFSLFTFRGGGSQVKVQVGEGGGFQVQVQGGYLVSGLGGGGEVRGLSKGKNF